MPDFQNPTGRTMSPERRRRLVELAVEHDGHKPDTTIEVSESEGKVLISQGRARAVSGKATKVETEAAKVAEAVRANTTAAESRISVATNRA